MTDEEFYQFIEDSMDELSEKQSLLEREYGFGSYARWSFDQRTEKFQLLDQQGNVKVDARVIDIGSYSPESKSWKWAWSNESVLPALREQSARLKGLETYTDIAMFGNSGAFAIEGESMAWELAAMSIKYLGAMGCYRGPSSGGNVHVFFAITEVSRVAA